MIIPDPTVLNVEAVIQGGQSNSDGTNIETNGCNSPPAGIPTDTVALFRRTPGTGVDPTANTPVLRPLEVTSILGQHYHGIELVVGQTLRDELPTSRIAILKVQRGSTHVAEWIEGGPYNADLQLAISDFTARVQETYPNATIRWHWVWNQGEAESRDASQTAALAWASNFATLKTQMQSYIGGQTLRPNIIKTWHSLAGGTWVNTVRSQQATAASAASGYLVDVDTIIDSNIQSDNIHWTATGQNQVGALVAANILFDIDTH